MDSNNGGRPEFYALLNVTQGASSTEIRAAFLRLSLQYHPDKGRFSPTTSHNKFIQLRKAYETLMDPIRRMEYDYQFPPYVPNPEPSFDLRQRYKLIELDHFETSLETLDCAFNHFRRLACTGGSIPFGLPRDHSFEKLTTAIRNTKRKVRAWQIQLRVAVNNLSIQIGVDKHSELIRKHQKLVNWIKTVTKNLNDICSHYYRLQRFCSWALIVRSPAIDIMIQECEDEFTESIDSYLVGYNQ